MPNVDNYFEQAGSGSDNKLVLGGSMETAGAQNLKKIYLPLDMTDVSTSNEIFIPSPVAGTITKVSAVINGAIAAADADTTLAINGTNVTGGLLTIAYNGSAAGDVFTATPTALNTVAVDDYISIDSNGASTNTVRATYLIEITLS